jgi:hypothetical protein
MDDHWQALIAVLCTHFTRASRLLLGILALTCLICIKKICFEVLDAFFHATTWDPLIPERLDDFPQRRYSSFR